MEHLKRIRKARGLSQSALAEMVGANQATISKLERGEGNPTLEFITRVARALSCEPSDLLERSELKVMVMLALDAMTPERQAAARIVVESMASQHQSDS